MQTRRNNSEEPRPQPIDIRQTQTEINLGSMGDDAWANHEWKKRWARAADGRAAATWNTPWEISPLTLYENLPKHQTTALMLLRTEVIGINAWLASIHVPDI